MAASTAAVLALAAVLTHSHQTTASSPAQPAIALGFGVRLVGDGADLFSPLPSGVAPRVLRPAKTPPDSPVLAPDPALYPWEGTAHMYGSVVTVSPTEHRLYYACGVLPSKANASVPDAGSAVCVATSADGVAWTRPMMGLVPWDNHTRTNMVFASRGGWVDTVVAVPPGEPSPLGAPPGTRFVLAFDDGTTDASERALQLATSPDGFRFTPLERPPALPPNFADTSVSLAYDPATRAWVAFGRRDGAPDQHPGERCGAIPPPQGYNMRSVRGVIRAASLPAAPGGQPTLLNFTADEGPLAFCFDRLDEQCLDVYNSAAVVVATPPRSGNADAATQRGGSSSRGGGGAPVVVERAYVAFPAVFLHYGEEENNGVLDVRFAFSRNGTRFEYVGRDRGAYVPRGIGAGVSLARDGLQPSLFNASDGPFAARWDAGYTYMYRGVIDHGDGTQSMYYWGQQGSHARQSAADRGRFGVGRVVQVRHRWVGLGADVATPDPALNGSAAPLALTTRPVTLPQCANLSQHLHLTINAYVSVGGNLSIALLDAGSGTALPGFRHDDCLAIVGNRLAAPLRYRRGGAPGNATGDLGPASHGAVMMDVRLRPPARLFAWEFACE